MKVIVDYINKEKCNFSKAEAARTCKEAIKAIGFFNDIASIVNVSVAFVPIAEMKEINTRYRKKNEPTDVLSFSEYFSQKKLLSTQVSELFLGEILVCCEYIRKSDTMKARNEAHAIRLRIAHGVLHLAGFRHGKKMFSLQEQVSKQ